MIRENLFHNSFNSLTNSRDGHFGMAQPIVFYCLGSTPQLAEHFLPEAFPIKANDNSSGNYRMSYNDIRFLRYD